MLFNNYQKWVLVILISILLILPLAQTELVGDSHLKITWPRKRGSHAIYAVGDRSKILISASNYKSTNGTESQKVGISSTGRCSDVIDVKSGTFKLPCKLTTRKHDQIYHAECVDGKGSASITFFKLDGEVKDKSVQIITSDSIWAGFTNKKHHSLKQGTLNGKGDRVAVVLNCKNDKRGRY